MIPNIKFLTIAHVDVLKLLLGGEVMDQTIEPGPVGSRFFLPHFQLSQNPCCFAVLIHIHSLLVLLVPHSNHSPSTRPPQTLAEPQKPHRVPPKAKSSPRRNGTVLMNMLERLLETTEIDARDVETEQTLLLAHVWKYAMQSIQ